MVAASRTSATARSGSRVKSCSRWPTSQPVWVSRAYSGYIEYVGAKLSASRPGPPKAWSRCSITSLEPFAAQTWLGVTPCPRYAASASRSATNSRSG